MSASRQVTELLDMVEAEPGWRVTRTGVGWQIFPPDRTIPPIHVRDYRELDVTRTSLRRAGFAPLLRKQSLRSNQDMPVANGKAAAPIIAAPSLLPPIEVAPAPGPRNLIREARAKIQDALDALGAIDELLGQIEGEREKLQQLKDLLASALK